MNVQPLVLLRGSRKLLFIYLFFLPGTHPAVSSQSTRLHGRRSPPSPPVWDGHADLAWVAHRSCTCRADNQMYLTSIVAVSQSQW